MKFLRPSLAILAFLPLTAAAQSVISNTVLVPLHYKPVNDSFKLGIYASLGGGAPKIFEFDTGGWGFYAAYATNNQSPWWGSAFNTTSQQVKESYDSGIEYHGLVVTTAVSLYADHHSSAPLVTTAETTRVGQMTNISNTNGASYWTPQGEATNGTPPIDQQFYGDFGMGLSYASNGIVNIVMQLTFTNGVTPGFRVRGHSNSPYLQIGLTAADTNSSSAFYFGMNTNTNAPPGEVFPGSGKGFYSEQVFNANMTISNSTTNFSANLGITTDTGASTTIHNADLGGIPEALYTNDGKKLHVVGGADFGLSGRTVEGNDTNFFSFVTTDKQVSIQEGGFVTNLFYLNSGIALFQQYDVIYNLQDGQIGFEATPEPSTWALLGLSALLLVAASRKSIFRQKETKLTKIRK